MHSEIGRRSKVAGTSVMVILATSLVTARPARPAPKPPKPTPTRTVTVTPAGAPTSTPTPTPPPLPSPTATPTTVPDGLAVQISLPAEGAQIDGDRVTVQGSFQGPLHTAIVVNDVLAYVSQGKFIANDVPLAAGSNLIVANGRTTSGLSSEASVNVSSSGTPPSFSVTADPTAGNAPLSVHFVPTWRGSQTPRSLTIDFDGDGTVDLRPPSPLAPVDHEFAAPGLYLTTFTLQDKQKRVHIARIGTLVTSPDQIDALFASLWDGMNDELLAGDVSGALSYLTPEAREIYQDVFNRLISDMPTIVPSYSRPVRVSQSSLLLEYAVTRMIDGEKRAFFVTAILDADGAWRIDSF